MRVLQCEASSSPSSVRPMVPADEVSEVVPWQAVPEVMEKETGGKIEP